MKMNGRGHGGVAFGEEEGREVTRENMYMYMTNLVLFSTRASTTPFLAARSDDLLASPKL